MAKDRTGSSNPVQYYTGLIASYERKFQPWESRSEKILKRYRDEQRASKDTDQTKFNILWSNVNTLVPATYSRTPQPDVARRFRDQDPVGRVASLILERALTFEIEHYPDYTATMKESVLDRFLPGRGTAWARYEPHFKAAASQLPVDGLQVTEDQDSPAEQIDYECAPVDYVHWKDFGHNVARTWEEVFVVWRCVYMYEEGVAERFGEKISKELAYDATPEDKKKELTQQEVKKQARIYEIWDKQKKKAFWLSKAHKTLLDEQDDPLGLKDFFPCPKPLFATMSNDSLVPVPDFALYQDQARELDLIADRIDGLVKMLQVKGVYDASIPILERLFTEGTNGTLLPVKNWAAFAEKKGLLGSIDIIDLKPIYEAIKVCFESAREIVNFIYQITGISDIVRGQTEASETLGAQQLKVNFVGLRMGELKRDVAQYATELLQMKAQIMCQKYAPQTITAMAAVEQLAPADLPLVPEAMKLLVGEQRLTVPEAESPNPLRSFRVEVNADSLIQLDEQAEKEDAKEFLGGISKFLEIGAQVGAVAPQMVPMMFEILKWATTKFKIGKSIEGTLDQAMEQLKQSAANPQQRPDPEMMKVQAEAKLKAQDQAHSQQLEQQKQAHEKQLADAEAARTQDFERWKVEQDNNTKIRVAELQADAKTESALSKGAETGKRAGDPQKGRTALDKIGEMHASQMQAMMTALEQVAKMVANMAQMIEHQQRPTSIEITRPDGTKLRAIAQKGTH